MISDHQRPSKTMGIPWKHISLLTLTVQNSALILIMHYSRIMPLVHGRRYLPSTAVLATEVIKLAVSLTLALYDISSKHPNSPATTLFGNLLSAIFGGDSWKMAIPALLYTLQNTLQYTAISNLDASTFQITYQLKILTTAVFSVLLLGRKLSLRKWVSLLLLTVGVATVQIPFASLAADIESLKESAHRNYWYRRSFGHWDGVVGKAAKHLGKRSATYQGIDEDFLLQHPRLNGTVGLVAVIVACVSSGLAGVYFEKLLKNHSTGQGIMGGRNGGVGVWVRETQLCFYSLFPALFIGVIFKDGENVARYGFFTGYNWVVWLTIVMQAAGGVIVALVIAYANNIAKNFATSISIVISFVASIFFFNLPITLPYVIGTATVLAATWLYNSDDVPQAPAVVVADYEKSDTPVQQSYMDDVESRMGRPSLQDIGRSTSRPSTPLGHERHHFRVPSARRHMEKRDA